MITFWAGASEPATTHETIARDRLVPLLRRRFADRDGMVAAVFDVYCGGDLDLLILKESGIIVVELKECASPICASENGSWAIRDGSPGEVLRGGSHGNPYRQVRAYRFALMTWMDQHAPDFMSSQKAAHFSFAHIAGVVALSPYLHPDSELDIDFRGQPWFHLVGFDELAARIDELRSPEISLTADEIERIVRHSLRCDQLMLASKDWEIHDPFVSLPATPPAAGASLVPDTEQDRAVEHRGTHLKIAAAVGTGKTTVLVRRAVQLAQQDGAGALLVITFSSQAAAKLYQQLRQLAPADLPGLWLGTFHSICRRMLVEHAEKMGYSQAFGVVDQADAMAVIERCVPEGSFADPGRLWALWSFAKNSLQPWQRIVTKPPFDAIKTPEPVLGCIHDGYTARLRHSDRMDFDDLLVNCLELLESHPDVCARYQERFRHILVDEYEDTSPVQGRILALLARDANVTVAGDEDQAIYGFRASTRLNLMELDTHIRGAAAAKLTTNHRSTPEILEFARASIRNNSDAAKRALVPLAKRSGQLPYVIRCQTQESEADFVVQTVREQARAGCRMQDIAILYRSRRDCEDVQRAFDTAGIAWRHPDTGSWPFLNQEHVRDAFAWLRLALNPEDTVALGRVFTQKEGLSDALFREIEESALSAGMSIWEAAAAWPDRDDAQARDAMAALRSLAFDLHARAKSGARPPDLLSTLVEQHYGEYARRQYGAASDSMLDDLEVLAEVARYPASLPEFLEEVARNQLEIRKRSESTAPNAEDTVLLSTIHLAKGSQWPIVFVTGVTDRSMPRPGSHDIREERRTFYVAVTRAQRQLYLTCPGTMGGWKAGPCRFVSEIPKVLYRALSV